jgi:hypothetical protein
MANGMIIGMPAEIRDTFACLRRLEVTYLGAKAHNKQNNVRMPSSGVCGGATPGETGFERIPSKVKPAKHFDRKDIYL